MDLIKWARSAFSTPAIATTAATATTTSVKQNSELFKLDIDSIEKVFDYLSLKELINCAHTCKLMQAVAGHVFQLNYPFAHAIVDDGHIYVNVNGVRYNIDIFTEHVKCIMFTNGMSDRLQIQWHQFKSLVHVNFYYSQFNAQQIRLMENILHQAESIILSNCQFDDELFQDFFEMCHRTKQLSIGMTYDCGTNWLHGTYPMLKQLGIWPLLRSCGKIQEFRHFVQENRNISTFVFSLKFLFDNIQSIMTMKCRDLHVIVDDDNIPAYRILMRELYEKGVYQRFHLMFSKYFDVPQQLIDQLSTFDGLVGFQAPVNANQINLNSFFNLEILEFRCNSNQISNLPQLVRNLQHLKEVHFHRASVDDILPFLMQLTKLKKISVENMTNSPNGWKWIDLHAVNEGRRKLLRTTSYVSKVTIYIVEGVYLRTRLKSTTMSLDFVEMQRFERIYKMKY